MLRRPPWKSALANGTACSVFIKLYKHIYTDQVIEFATTSNSAWACAIATCMYNHFQFGQNLVVTVFNENDNVKTFPIFAATSDFLHLRHPHNSNPPLLHFVRSTKSVLL